MSNQKRHIKKENVDCPFCLAKEYSIYANGFDYECQVTEDEFQFVKCNHCGLLRLNPRPIQAELKHIYPKNYNAYIFNDKLSGFMKSIRNTYLRGKVNKIKKIVGEKANILEGGCGDGEFSAFLKKYGGKGWKLFGNDIVNIAERKLKDLHIGFINGRFEDIDMKKGKWDLIILKDVIEHLDNPDHVIKATADLLRSGGILLLDTPTPQSWDAILFKKKYWAGWHFPRHWTIYTVPQIRSQFEKYGLRVIKIEPILSPVSWLYSIKYWLRETKNFNKFSNFFDEKYLLPTGLFYLLNIIQVVFTGKTSTNSFLAIKK